MKRKILMLLTVICTAFNAGSQIEITYQGAVSNQVVVTNVLNSTEVYVDVYLHNLSSEIDTIYSSRTWLNYNTDWLEQIIHPNIGFSLDDSSYWYSPIYFTIDAFDSVLYRTYFTTSNADACIINRYDFHDKDSNIVNSFTLHLSTTSEACFMSAQKTLNEICQVHFDRSNKSLNVIYPISTGTIYVYDLSGKLVLSDKIQEGFNVIPVEKVANNLYLVTIVNENKVLFSEKLYFNY